MFKLGAVRGRAARPLTPPRLRELDALLPLKHLLLHDLVYDGLQRLLSADNLYVCLPFDYSSAIMALITSRTRSGLVTFVALDPLAPMICVAHWNSATSSSIFSPCQTGDVD